jgi:hypothetical protein
MVMAKCGRSAEETNGQFLLSAVQRDMSQPVKAGDNTFPVWQHSIDGECLLVERTGRTRIVTTASNFRTILNCNGRQQLVADVFS